MTEETLVCRDCGQTMFEAFAFYDEEPICEECFCNHYNRCDHCDTVLAEDDDQVCVDDIVCCQTCAERYWQRCRDCDDWFDPNSCDYSVSGYCNSCSEHYFECASCGEIHHNDDYGGDDLCRDCYEEVHSGHIHPYHSAEPDLHFHGERDETLFFGVELETESYDELDEAAEALYNLSDDESLFWLSEDCSLSDGVEIISQPCTLDYHQDHFPWRKIVEAVQQYGGCSERASHAAMHIHFSNAFFGKRLELCQVKLIYLFEKFRPQLLLFGRTSSYLADRSAKEYHCPLYNIRAKQKVWELKSHYSRYQSVNILGRETTEIRIFRGTLRVTDILASLELIDLLAHMVKKLSTTRLQELTWEGVVKRANTKQYRYLSEAIEKYVGGEDNETDRDN